jgi:hypothetical protein
MPSLPIHDLLRQPILALKAVFEADQAPVGVFDFDAPHGRRNDFAFELLDPVAALVDDMPPVDGIDRGSVRKLPFQGHGPFDAVELLPLGTAAVDVPVAVRRPARRSGPVELVGFL